MSPHMRQKVIAAKERRAKVELRLLRGETNQRNLAVAFGVSKSTIHKDVQLIEREWAKRRLRRSSNERNRAVAFYEHIKQEAMNAWDKQASTQLDEEEGGTGCKRRKKEQTGNPALLQKAIDAQTRIDKICGNEAPQQVSAPDGGPIPIKVLLEQAQSIPPEELESICAAGRRFRDLIAAAPSANGN